MLMRTVLAALAGLVAAGAAGLPPSARAARTQSSEARIKIDVDRTIGEVDPLLFGNFAEHLGRMIYGGIYEEGSPLSDEIGYRLDVLEAVRGLNVSILRWPGGNFCSGYDWRDGIGPKDERPARAELAWGALETNRFGTDELLRYAEMIGAEAYLCVNLGLGTVDDARYWIEYTNEARETYWARQRRANGREAPWDVKYWALGNEIDGPWQLGDKTAGEYAVLAREAAQAMRAIDPDIKLAAAGSSNYGADWIDWNRTVLEELNGEVDYIAIHTYINNRADDFERFMAWSQRIDQYIEITADLIRQVKARRPTRRPLYIAYDEWNVWYRAWTDDGLEEVYNFEDALAMGMFFNSFFRHADVVKMANLAQLVNVIAPIMTSEDGLFLQTIYFPLAELTKQSGNVALDVFSESPIYRIDERPVLGYLDVSGTYDPETSEIFLNVLNRSLDRDLTTRIENQTGALAPSAEAWELDHPDLKATHGFGDDEKVRPVVREVTLELNGNAFTYTFPAHSLTILRLRNAGS